MAEARVVVGGTRADPVPLPRDRPTTFGRFGCDLVVGANDNGVSRLAGTVAFDGGSWRVTNRSETRTLRVVDGGTRIESSLAVARDDTHPYVALQGRSATVFIDGAATTYALELSGLTQAAPPVLVGKPEGGSSTLAALKLTARQREVLVALAWGYLQPYPAYDPRPARYEDVAARIGASEKRVDAHCTTIRKRLTDAGIPGLVGLPDARAALVARALELRLVGSDDVAWLNERIATKKLALAEDVL